MRSDTETDVCVIGGGLAGLSTALGLAERDVKVVLIEARRVGWGASGRNGGFVSAGFSLSPRQIVKDLGREQAREVYDLSRDAVALIRRRIKDLELPGVPVVDGRMKVLRYHDPEQLARDCDFMAEVLAIESEVWPRERLREVLLSERYHGALYIPSGFHFHPLNYALGIAQAAETAGVKIYEDTPAVWLNLESPQKRIETPSGAVLAREIVIACGGYIAGLQPLLSGATLPVATYVMTTEPLGARLKEAIRVPYAISDTRLAGNYFRALSDGRILWGGDITARTREPGQLAKKMIDDLLSVFPQLAGVRAEDAWMGLMGYPIHKMPQLGRHAPGVWHCMGYGGHGMAATTMGGELIAAAIAERDDRYRLFSRYGLQWTGGRVIGAVAAQMTYWYYQWLDRLQEARSHG
ncbi:NAD(P)/FAD-dependent oxidoreductase [Denitrobaculum tricleocarpae]|uniref:NAD(P)/FAD-dependent oxidoreductase n=1 Tax=Denitrobaculum tricleocarpae TaxID=2591009 RepID=UPI001FE62D68|nr:FAD-dependent oxidoreductase [Denitrobaculum tricleocarpae]